MGRVRPFVRDDMPDVVSLRRRAFRHTVRTDTELATYMEDVFLQNPWRSDDLPALVCEDTNGRLTGFLGVVPRRVMLDGRPLRMAVSTQLMVEENHAQAAVQLMMAFMRGPQDLSFADVSGKASTALWRRLGGGLSPVQRLGWTHALRPARHHAVAAQRRSRVRGLAFGLRPLTAAIDRAYADHPVSDDLTASNLTAEMLAAAPAGMLPPDVLRPDYDVASVEWLLAHLREARPKSDLQSVALRDRDGTVVGWYLYLLNAGGVSEVIQVAAAGDRYSDLLRHLAHHAWQRGGVTLAGRVEPLMLPALADQRVTLNSDGPFVLLHSRSSDVTAAAERGRIFLSRLEGEWWTSF